MNDKPPSYIHDSMLPDLIRLQEQAQNTPEALVEPDPESEQPSQAMEPTAKTADLIPSDPPAEPVDAPRLEAPRPTHTVTPHGLKKEAPFVPGIFSHSDHKPNPFDRPEPKRYKFRKIDEPGSKPDGYTQAVIDGRKVEAEILKD